MQALVNKYGWLLLLAGICMQCRKPYEPAVLKSGDNYLVVDGFINTSTGGITNVMLSRTKNLSDTVITIQENGASIHIEGMNGTQYALQETSPGNYNSDALALAAGTGYRLAITTANGKRYQSDYSTSHATPAIDSVNWQQDDAGVTVYVNTHDPANNTHFYRWQYIETWEYQSQLQSPYGVANGMVYVKTPQQQVDVCYSTTLSTSVLLGNTSALSQDMVSQKLLFAIPANDSTLQYRMSILVRQYALTPAAFFYWQIIQKNTEDLGTLFDLQPSQLNGNIHSLSDATEPVVGFVTANTVSENRIFIDKTQLINWQPPIGGYNCSIKTIPANANFLIYDYPDPDYTIYYYAGPEIVIAKKTCLNCTLSGGTNVKPAFW